MDQEFVSPALQGLETLCVVDVVHEHTAVGSAVECNSQGLETLLSGSVPNLSQDGIKISQQRQHTEGNIANTHTLEKYVSWLSGAEPKNVGIGSTMTIDGAIREGKKEGKRDRMAKQREGERGDGKDE